MRALIWFLKEFYLGNVNESTRMKSIKQENITETEINEKNVIVPWITIEGNDDTKYFDDFLKDILVLKERFNSNKVILVPFAHLTEKIFSVKSSFNILNSLKDFLIDNGFDCKLGHFGSSKDVRLNCPADPYQVIHRVYPNADFKKGYYKNK